MSTARCIAFLRSRFRLVWAIVALAAFIPASLLADEAPLHERIDRLMTAAAVGPVPPPASDAEFLRRAWLDLGGMIPSVAEAREFLADTRPDKREKLIDRLLASPQYVRRMTLLLDLTLLERKRAKATIKDAEWERFLYDSLAANKPYDQLVQEILAADGVDPKLRPAAKFFLDRECEPNLLTRDIGRLFYGMDLQCAQCHDHPIVDDYYQADYYGLFAFVNRTFAFTDAKTKTTYVAEKAEGDVSYKSVFTGDSGEGVAPRLPKEAALVEPVVAKGAEYLVKPAKNVRPVPKYSRRAQLAAVATDSDAFSRNIVNRLWALMMGRGIVHPVEMHHVDNPPSHPELLSLLASEFEAHEYDIRWLLRELALSQTYQRSCDLPRSEDLPAGAAAKTLATLEVQKKERDAENEQALARLFIASGALTAAKEKNQKEGAGLPALQTALTKAKAAADKASAALAAAQADVKAKEAQTALVAEAAAKAKEAAAALKDDKILAAAAAQIAERAKAVSAAQQAGEKVVAEKAAQGKLAADAVAAAQATVEKLTAGLVSAEQLAKLEADERTARNKAHEARYRVADYAARSEIAELLVEHEQLVKTDAAGAARIWDTLIERWTARQQIAMLKPLSAEQFAISQMQAVGVVAIQQASAEANITAKPPKELKQAVDADKARLQAELVEQKVYTNLAGNVGTFVRLYDSLPGEDFQATLNQALFFGNGNVVEAWLKPSGDNLAARLTKLTDASALADELYLSVFIRQPTAEERADVAAYLQDRTDDRAAALAEMAWALLSSSEFRFNH